MVIHPEAQASHFDSHIDEGVVARLLDEAFDITHASELEDLSYWMAQPTAIASERFGFQKEVAVIYSRHERTDARSLRLFKKLLTDRRLDLSDRVEPSVFLVIHNGDPDELGGLLQTFSDQVVVPFTATDIRANKGTNFIRRRLADTLGRLDPFGLSSPITADRDFFGRREFVQTLYSRTRAQRQNSGVFGLRKTGKTSVLFALRRRLEAEGIIATYIDCQSPGAHSGRWWQLLEYLIERIERSVQVLNPSMKRSATVHLEYTQANAAQRFAADVGALLGDGDTDQVVLLLDEIEYVTPEISGRLSQHWDEDFLPFWQTIRAVHQELEGRLVFVVAGVNPACIERPHFEKIQNPIFELADSRYLEPFGEAGVRDMVRTIGRYGGLQFDEAVFGDLTRIFGGHPYLTRLACSEVWKRVESTSEALTKTDNRDFDDAREKVRLRLAEPIRDILLSLVWWYPDQYDLLRILADGDESFVHTYFSDSPEEMAQYARYGLLDAESEKFSIELIREFLLQHGDTYKAQVSPFTRSNVAPDILPALVTDQDLLELFQGRVDIENRLRRVIVLYLAVVNGYDDGKTATAIIRGLPSRSDRRDPGQLFVGRSPGVAMEDLYLDDLRVIVEANWETFKPLFEDKAPVRYEHANSQ